MKIVLSIDGGGIRGLVPAAVLDYLEKKIHEIRQDNRIKIGSLVDLVGGTSTGSILGSLMLLPCEKLPEKPRYFMSEISQMYIHMGPDVFKKTIWHNIKTLWGLAGPVFPASNIEPYLLQMLDHYKMKDLVKPCLFNAYDIDKRRINVFTNKDSKEKYAEYYVKDIVRGSTSIPAYFPPAYFNQGLDINTLVDGGVFANNPSMISYIEATKTLFSKSKVLPKDVFMISLGTGASQRKQYPYVKAKKWGMTNWVFPILDILLSGSSDVVDYEMMKLYEAYGEPDNYVRINPALYYSTSPATDASKENITNLIKDVNQYIKENKVFLDNLAQRICDLNYKF
jgi:uncharacterized protein